MTEAKHIEKLPNSPLQEVVFELLWELETSEVGLPSDSDFELSVGIFAEKIKHKLPHTVKKGIDPFPGIHISFYPYPKYQFWKAPGVWPVVQIGHGILVVNDVEKNYTWKSFKTNIDSAIDALHLAFKNRLRIMGVRLKYIDAFDIGSEDTLIFINENFNISVENNFDNERTPQSINIVQRFNYDELGSLDMSISSAMKEPGMPSILWQSVLSKESPILKPDLNSWLDKVHAILSNNFKTFVKPHFYASFTKNNVG